MATIFYGMNHELADLPAHMRQAASARPARQRRRGPAPRLLDPDDLCRRLHRVLAEREAQDDRRRMQPGPAAFRGRKRHSIDGIVTESLDKETMLLDSSRHEAPDNGDATGGTRRDLAKDALNGPRDLERLRATKVPLQESAGSQSSKSSPYVPREAASQFARTTTPIGMLERRMPHMLSKQVCKFTIEKGPDRCHLAPTLHGPESLGSQLRHKVPAPRVHEIPGGYMAPLETAGHHTFRFDFLAGKQLTHNDGDRRRSSAGWLTEVHHRDESQERCHGDGRSSVAAEQEEEEEEIINPYEHRVDWTQSDETKHCTITTIEQPVKQKSSIWGLRSRRGSSGKPERILSEGRHTVDETIPLSPKSFQIRFFSEDRSRHEYEYERKRRRNASYECTSCFKLIVV